MRTRSTAARIAALGVAGVLWALAPAAATAPGAYPLPTRLGGWHLASPAPGHGIIASAITTSGQHLDLVLETDLDGVTRDVTGRLEASGVVATTGVRAIQGGDPACSDGKYNLLPFKRYGTWEWWFAARTTPAGLAKRKAESALKAAVRSITGERNDCGRPDRVSATARYLGRTTTRPGVRPDRSCAQDGRDVVGFGTLPNGVLALTCTAYALTGTVHPAVESDVLFNKRYYTWTTTLAGCTDQVMLRSVATHEFGHVFGLNHVSERTHGSLTMSPAIGPCDDSAFTLGKGDMLGLERRY